MMGLSKVTHVFLTSSAIQNFRKQYWPVAMSRPMYDELPPGLLLAQHFGHLLMITSLQFDERTRDATFQLGWQTGQLLATVGQEPYERPGLWYLRPPGSRNAVEPQPRYLKRFDEDLRLLPKRPEDAGSTSGFVLMTTGLDTGKGPVTARAFIYSLDRQSFREVPIQTDPREHR